MGDLEPAPPSQPEQILLDPRRGTGRFSEGQDEVAIFNWLRVAPLVASEFVRPKAETPEEPTIVMSRPRIPLGLLIALAGLLLAPNANAQEAPCTIRQLTNTTDSSFSSLSVSVDGGVIALTAEIDPLGTNADGNSEVFLVNTESGAFSQVTFSTGDVIPPLGGVNNDTLVSPDGMSLLFSSFRDYAGENADLGQELFRYGIVDGQFEQLTNSPGGGSSLFGGLSLAADSDTFSFFSNFDPMGTNPAGVRELWLLGLTSGDLTRLTVSGGGTNAASGAMDDSGLLRVFSSREDFTGENPDSRFEAFLVTTDSLIIEQLTDSPAPIENTATDLTPDGTEVLVSSSGDLDGLNPENNREVFLLDVSTLALSLVTDGVTSTSGNAQFSDDGLWVLFVSDGDFVSPNPTTIPRLYRYERSTGELSLVADSPSNRVSLYALDDGATTVAFTHDGDLVGENPDGNTELFVAACQGSSPPVFEVPSLSGMASVLFVLLLSVPAILILGRRS